MSCFKRANWHSGLTYTQQCKTCRTRVIYTDYDLGYRAWFPDGFVYCPTCKTPLRHNEAYAEGQNGSNRTSTNAARAAFCSQCGHKYADYENFCPICGNKR